MKPNIRGALLWSAGIVLAAGVWGYVAARLSVPYLPFLVFAAVIASAAFFPPDRFKLWPK